MNANDIKRMEGIFASAGIGLDERASGLFSRYYDMLAGSNDDRDLTRLTRFDDIIIKHFVDSVYILKLTELSFPLVDIGTGAGFPGIPLAIMNPGRKIILAEHRRRRVDFLESAVSALGLAGVEVYPHLVTEKSFFEVQGVITRALESVDGTLSRVGHFLPAGGRVYFLKGPAVGRDMDDLSESNRKNFTIEESREYALPGTDYRRCLVVARKTAERTAKTYFVPRDPDRAEGVVITSKDNARFKVLRQAAENPKKSGRTIIAGKRIITDYLSGNTAAGSSADCSLVLYDGYIEKDDGFRAIIEDFTEHGALMILKKGLYNELDVLDSGSPLLIAPRPGIPVWDGALETGCALALPFQDPVNIGTAIRSAAGFGAGPVILLEGSADPFHPKAVRTSSGAVFHIALAKGPTLVGFCAMCAVKKIPLVPLDSHGIDMAAFDFPDAFVLLPGIEGPGLPDELKKTAVSIPLEPGIESLNASISASIALYEWKKRQR